MASGPRQVPLASRFGAREDGWASEEGQVYQPHVPGAQPPIRDKRSSSRLQWDSQPESPRPTQAPAGSGQQPAERLRGPCGTLGGRSRSSGPVITVT